MWLSVLILGLIAFGLTDSTETESTAFVFGTQSLACLSSGSSSSSSSGSSSGSIPSSSSRRSSIRYRRDDNPTRWTIRTRHRLIRYQGLVFEWFNGSQYHIGPNANTTRCRVRWEWWTAGHSTCSDGVGLLRSFASQYRYLFGDYAVLGNNCHDFANRASYVLTYCRNPDPR